MDNSADNVQNAKAMHQGVQDAFAAMTSEEVACAEPDAEAQKEISALCWQQSAYVARAKERKEQALKSLATHLGVLRSEASKPSETRPERLPLLASLPKALVKIASRLLKRPPTPADPGESQ